METLLCLTMFDTLSKFWYDPAIHNQDFIIKSLDKKQILLFTSQSFLDRVLFLTAFHHSAILQHAKWPHPVLGCSGQVAQHSCGRRFNKRPCWIATTKCYRAFCFKHLAFQEIKQEFEGWIVKFKEHQRTSQFPEHPCLIVGGSGSWWFSKNPPTTDIITIYYVFLHVTPARICNLSASKVYKGTLSPQQRLEQKKMRMSMWLGTMGFAWFCSHGLVHISRKLRIKCLLPGCWRTCRFWGRVYPRQTTHLEFQPEWSGFQDGLWVVQSEVVNPPFTPFT